MKWLLFFAMEGVTLYYVIMYEAPQMYRLMFVMGVWFLLVLIQFLYNRFSLTISLKRYTGIVSKNSMVAIPIEIENRGWIPIPFMEIQVKTDFQKHAMKKRYSLKGREQLSDTFYIKAQQAGFCTVSVRTVRWYDWLHVFSGSRRYRRGANGITILVLPSIYPTAIEIPAVFRYFGEESGLYYEDEIGNDPSEILELREYRSGDRLQKVHWKLSQKTGNLIVKEFSEPMLLSVVFLLDTMDFSEAFLEVFLSVSMELCEQKCLHYVACRDAQGMIVRKPVIREEHIYQILQFLMDTISPDKEGRNSSHRQKAKEYSEDVQSRIRSLMQQYDDWYGKESYQVSLRLTQDLNLYRKEEWIGKLDAHHVEKSLAGLLIQL